MPIAFDAELRFLSQNYHSLVVHCHRSSRPVALARAVSDLLPSPSRVFEVHGDYLEHADQARFIAPLVDGETVVLLDLGEASLAATLAARWARVNTTHGPYTANFGPHGWFTLEKGSKFGTLVIIKIGGDPPGGILLRPSAEKVQSLETEGASDLLPILGRPSRAAYVGGDMRRLFKELCLLHLRDPRPEAAVEDVPLLQRTTELRWSEIQRLLRSEPDRDYELLMLHERGLVDREKRDFYLGALDALREYQREQIRSCIWEAVWDNLSREAEGQVFRGQASEAWRLDNSLLRPPPGATALAAGEFERRPPSNRHFPARA